MISAHEERKKWRQGAGKGISEGDGAERRKRTTGLQKKQCRSENMTKKGDDDGMVYA